MLVHPAIASSYGERQLPIHRGRFTFQLGFPICRPVGQERSIANVSSGKRLGPSPSTPPPSLDSLADRLKRCSDAGTLDDGRAIHAYIHKCGHFRDTFLGNCLIHMYGSFRSSEEAGHVFESMPRRNVFTWNMMIKALAQDGDLEGVTELFAQMPERDGVSWNTAMSASIKAHQGMPCLCLFRRMLLECVLPDRISLLCMLDACCSRIELSEQGSIAHVFIASQGLDRNMAIATSLSNMYGRCGNLMLAMSVFRRMEDPPPDGIAWSTIISIAVHNGEFGEALDLFLEMWIEGADPNTASFISALDACADLMAIRVGREIHATIVIATGLEPDASLLLNTLISMYGRCGYVDDAANIFDRAASDKADDAVTWNAFIACLVHNESCNEALRKFRSMEETAKKLVVPDKVTFVCVLDACAKTGSLIEGREIHALATCMGSERETVVGTALVNMYGKCAQLQDASLVFSHVEHRDMVCWNALIAALSQNRDDDEALRLFYQMQSEGIVADHVSFICALEACSDLTKGYDLHKAMVATGYGERIDVSNALVCMYGRLSGLDDAKHAFAASPPATTSASWNAMITVLSRNGSAPEALQLFFDMERGGFRIDKISFVCALDACGNLGALQSGRQIHACIVKVGYDDEDGDDVDGDVTVGTALISMYGRCSRPCCADRVFKSMSNPDTVAWNAMLTAVTRVGDHTRALQLLSQMLRSERVELDRISFLCVLDACASLASFEAGMEVHALVVESGFDGDAVLGTGAVNMYGKCGSVVEARSTFEPLRPRDVVAWNTMLAVYAQNGLASHAVDSLEQMLIADRVCPDEITFVCLLTACSHAGCPDTGTYLFAYMSLEHDIPWMRDHYGCMVDLLGRSGRMDEAEALIEQMSSSESGSVAWPSILSACRLHEDVNRGLRASKHCIERDSTGTTSHLALSNLMLACEGG